jgi:hypothetical protein
MTYQPQLYPVSVKGVVVRAGADIRRQGTGSRPSATSTRRRGCLPAQRRLS